MPRVGGVDRGLLQKRNTAGQLVWYVRLYHEGRERQFGSFPTKTKARQFYQKAKTEQHEGRFFPERFQRGGFAKLEEVLKDYLDTFTGRSKRDEERFQKTWVTMWPGIRLNAITPALLEKARTQMLTGRTPQTVNRYVGFLRRVLNKAVRDGKLTLNPVSRIKMFREATGETVFLSLEDEDRLCKALGPVHGAWVRLAILTGMRQMEQFSLTWEHVDLDRGILTLSKTKAGRVQHITLPLEALTIFRQLDEQATKAQALQEAEAIANHQAGQHPRSKWVFPSENPETHVDPRNFYRRIYLPKVKEQGLEGVSWHTLRHTFASRLAMSGMGDKTIAALLRHSGTSLVSRYAHLSPSHLQAAVEMVSSFGKSPAPEPIKAKADEPAQTTAHNTKISDATLTDTVTAGTARDEKRS